MGCFGSKEDEAKSKGDSDKHAKKSTSAHAVKMSWDRPARSGAHDKKQRFEQSRDPADYRAENLRGETFIRLPGQINDQRINVDGCQDCLFYLVDQCDSVQIDDCVNCKFFIGPTMSSVFVRNCKDCNFVVACGQLRTRDVKRCNFALYCQSRPCIESSTQIGIGCFYTPGYFQLSEHFAKARLSAFSNLYTIVHDFTPKDGNYSFIDQRTIRSPDFLPPLWEHTNGYVTKDECDALRETPVVAYTHGVQHHSLPLVRLVLFRPGAVDEAERLLQLLHTEFTAALDGGVEPQVLPLFSNEHRYTDTSITAIGSEVKLPLKAVKALVGNAAVALAFAYSDAARVKAITEAWSSAIGTDDAERAVLFEKEGDAASMAKATNIFFEKLPLEGMAFGSAH